jgi:phage terminase small subunit
MPHVKLTAKQEAFCQGIADGLGQADAYRRAYDAEGMKDNSIYPKASELMKNGKVSARIAELRAGVQEKQLWSREMSVKALVQAFREGSGAVKVSAVKELNAMHGYNEPAKLAINAQVGVASPQTMAELTQALLSAAKGSEK